MKISRYMRLAALGVCAALVVVLIWSGTDNSRISAQTKDLDGKQLYADNCAKCHGDGWTGGHAPDLTKPERQAKWADSDEKLVGKITHGGFRMPKFEGKLSAEQIKAIATYVRSLGAANKQNP